MHKHCVKRLQKHKKLNNVFISSWSKSNQSISWNIDIKETSGISKPSLSKFIPTSTSNFPSLKSLIISILFKDCSDLDYEKLADEIENAALSSMNKEISTSEIGEKVLMGLWKMDEVAYIRFASVYRQFKDINTFKNI